MKILPEWHQQKTILLSFPPIKSDWEDNYAEICDFYQRLIRLISSYAHITVLYSDDKSLSLIPINKNVLTIKTKLNDTWIRDYGPISVLNKKKIVFLDFVFNGWGLKFASNYDNQVTKTLVKHSFFKEYQYQLKDIVLEGGSIEYNGDGVLLTTSKCLLSKNRNEHLNKRKITKKLKKYFGIKKVLWLNHGYLAGDDTDSHIDTLARFCNKNTICYVQCIDKNDEHYKELKKMQKELKKFRISGKKLRLIPLPMPTAKFDKNDGHRLPATYANFLIMNDIVLMPTYNDKNDLLAKKQLQSAFKNKKIVTIDCSALIKQHGSLHCATMQIPAKEK